MKHVGDKISYVRHPFARNSYYCLVLGGLCLVLAGVSMYLSVARAGQGAPVTGAFGFSSIAAALMGLRFGLLSFREKERNYTLAKIGSGICLILVIVWIIIVGIGFVK